MKSRFFLAIFFIITMPCYGRGGDHAPFNVGLTVLVLIWLLIAAFSPNKPKK